MIGALVTDASQRQALVAMRELGSAGIAVCAVETPRPAPAFASRWCAESSVLPDFARDPDPYIDSLIELCAQRRPRALIPCHDGTIDALRSRRDDLERVVAVALAPEAPLAAALDKRTTLGVAETLGVRVPRGETVTDAGDAGAALDETGLPAVIKPALARAEQLLQRKTEEIRKRHVSDYARIAASVERESTPVKPPRAATPDTRRRQRRRRILTPS